jgi:hypothetical protein
LVFFVQHFSIFPRFLGVGLGFQVFGFGKRRVDFRGQISKNARFWDSDVPYRIGCWRGFWVMLGELGVKERCFCSTELQIFTFSFVGHVPDRIGYWWGIFG